MKALDSAAELYKTCQFVSLHIPATAETKNSINYALLKDMPKGAMLVNTARKEVINEAELIKLMEDRAAVSYTHLSTLLNTLSVNGIFLSSACGGKGSCGQCKCQVLEGGGEILPSEVPHFSRKQQQDHWRLGCQVKVKSDMSIKIDESVLGVKEWECEVISNKNVATFIKEFIVALPKGCLLYTSRCV